ncbi:MAG: hypothetical protein AB7O26_17180 [Planctomycetaceae bacterium]
MSSNSLQQRNRPFIGRLTAVFGEGWKALLIAAVVLPWLTGCDKLPKASDYIGKKEEEPAKAPTPPPPPPPAAPKPAPKVEPKKRAPEEIIGDFHKTKPKDRSDGLLTEMAGMEDGIDQITKLSLAESKVTDAGIKQLEKFDAVTELDLASVNFSNESMETVAKMKSLESLSLTNTPGPNRQLLNDVNAKTIDGSLAHVKNMPKLRRLTLSGAKFTEQGLDEISKMTDLEQLSLQGTFISDTYLERLSGLTNLRDLDLSKTRVTDQCFATLMNFKNLERLVVGSNKPINGKGFLEARKRKGLSKLRQLLVFDTSWGDDGMEAVAATPTLEYLDLGRTRVNDNQLMAVRKLKDLQFIYLHEMSSMTSGGMKHLSGLKDLRTIFLYKSRAVNDSALSNFKGLKKLERLVLTETSCTEAGARSLKKSLPDCAITIKNGMDPL